MEAVKQIVKMTKKNKQHRTVINIMIAVYTIGLLLFLLMALNSCNPVKQVLRDEYKMRKVWNEGALQGWCVNDTFIVNKSDTLITFDTLYSELDLSKLKITGDLYPDYGNNNISFLELPRVIKTVKITDTITNIVTDNSRIDLLQQQLNVSNDKGLELSRENDTLKTAANGFKGERNKWRFRFFLLLTIFGLFLFRKPLWKLATKFISPVKF